MFKIMIPECPIRNWNTTRKSGEQEAQVVTFELHFTGQFIRDRLRYMTFESPIQPRGRLSLSNCPFVPR